MRHLVTLRGSTASKVRDSFFAVPSASCVARAQLAAVLEKENLDVPDNGMKRPLIVASQKSYLSVSAAQEFARELVNETADNRLFLELALCPSFINLAHVVEIVRATNSEIRIGAQNVHPESRGALGGQVSLEDLLGLDVKYVTVGHCVPAESNEKLNQKIGACLGSGLVPIACIGENDNQRETGLARAAVSRDVEDILDGIDSALVDKLVIAYEPLWALAAHEPRTAAPRSTPTQANSMHEFIRNKIANRFGQGAADSVRIIYGGGVDGSNAVDFLEQPHIDGLLLGAASTSIGVFRPVLQAVETLALT